MHRFNLTGISFRLQTEHTAWKLHDFSIIQILCKINFENHKSAKCAILTHLEDLNLIFYEFMHFLNAEIYPISKIQSP